MTARRQPKVTVAEYNAMMAKGLRPAKPATKPTAAKGTRAGNKRAQAYVAPKVTTPKVPIRSRGPWVLEVDDQGRPMTVNDERSSALNPGTMIAVRQEKAAWGAGFAAAILACQIPPQHRVYLVFQPYYTTNVVPDPDAVAPLHKTIIDALVRAGVLVNDRREQLPLGYQVLPPVTDGGPARMTVTVFPLP